MVVGGRYEVVSPRNGFSRGDMIECVGADVKKSHGEFGIPPSYATSKKMRAAVWHFDWKDVRYLATPCMGPVPKGEP